jgi:hypothetical protein
LGTGVIILILIVGQINGDFALTKPRSSSFLLPWALASMHVLMFIREIDPTLGHSDKSTYLFYIFGQVHFAMEIEMPD